MEEEFLKAVASDQRFVANKIEALTAAELLSITGHWPQFLSLNLSLNDQNHAGAEYRDVAVIALERIYRGFVSRGN